jgi:hypothetical protein
VNLALRTTLTAYLRDGTNTANVRGSVGNMKLTSGLGADTFELRDRFVRGGSTIKSGAGADALKIANGLFGATTSSWRSPRSTKICRAAG